MVGLWQDHVAAHDRRLEKVSRGSIYFGDNLVNNLPPASRGVAMVFQN